MTVAYLADITIGIWNALAVDVGTVGAQSKSGVWLFVHFEIRSLAGTLDSSHWKASKPRKRPQPIR